VCARARTAHNVCLLVNLQAVDSPVGVFVCGGIGSNIVVASGIQCGVGFVAASLLPEIIQSSIRSTEICVEYNVLILEVSINIA
jgi:hypothetical protein